MTPENLEAIGIYLHGSGWKQRLADDLQVGVRSVKRWAAEELPIPSGAWNDLITLAACRFVEEQLKTAAINGMLGNGKLTIKAQPVAWDAQTDKEIKTRAAEIMSAYGLNAHII